MNKQSVRHKRLNDGPQPSIPLSPTLPETLVDVANAAIAYSDAPSTLNCERLRVLGNHLRDLGWTRHE